MDEYSDIAVGFLAGGLARRMGGRNKALLEIGGRNVLDWQLAATRHHRVRLINANGDAHPYQPFGLPIIADTISGNPGPLAGILACLEYLAEQQEQVSMLLSCATDAPFIPADLAARLWTALQAEDAVLAQARSHGRRHPVFGLWPVSQRARLRHAVQSEGIRKIDDFTALFSVAIVDFDEQPDPFLNVNTPEDIAHAEAALKNKSANRHLS